MKKRKTPEVRDYSLAGCESVRNGRGFEWSGKLCWRAGEPLPAERVFLWSAENLGLHLWCDCPPDVGRKVRGWFSAGRVATIGLGDRFAYSASRWLADPIEDADSLLKFAGELQAGCHSLGINLKGSPGSAAKELYRLLFVGRPPKVDHELNEFAEAAIYGGRAELLWPGEFEGAVSQWDRSAAYLAHLTDELPIVGTERWTGTADLESEGVTEALVEADPGVCPLPCLPVHVRLHQGEQRTVYGWGRFVGRWPNVELRAARERGYRIKPRGGVTFQRMGRNVSLMRFVDRVWNGRAKFPLAKRIGLALVGKFHEPRVSRVVRPFGPFKSLDDAKRAAREAGPGSIVVDHAHVVLALEERERFSWYVNMPLAAHVLALGRLELLHFAEANLFRLCTLATDGAILADHAPPGGVTIGKGLGEWRLDYAADRGVIHGALAYRLEAEGKPDKVRTAGVSRALAAKFLSGETVRWKSRATLMARGLAGLTVERRANARDFSGVLDTDEFGFMRPVMIKPVRTPQGTVHNVLA